MKVTIISSLIALIAVVNAAPTHQGARPVGWGSPVNVVKRVDEPILESRGGLGQGGSRITSGFGRGWVKRGGLGQGGSRITSGFGRGWAKRGYGESGANKPGRWTPPQLFNNDKFPLGVNPQPQQPQQLQQPQDSRVNVQQPPQGQEPPVNQLAGSNTNQLNVDSQADNRGQGSTLNQPILGQESQLAVNNAAVLSPTNTADTTETEFAEVQMNGGSTIQVPMGTIFPVSSTAPATQLITNSGHCMSFTPGTDNTQPEHILGADFSRGSPAKSLNNGDVIGFVWCQQTPFADAVKLAFDIRNLN